MARFEELMKAQNQQATAIATKQMNVEGWPNPNDIGWLYHYPQVDKQLGRAKRVYHRLMELKIRAEKRSKSC